MGVARVNGVGERRCGAEARVLIRAAGDPLELVQLHDLGMRNAHVTLALFLRRVEGGVGEPDERVAVTPVLGKRRDADADRDRGLAVTGVERPDAVDDRLRGSDHAWLVRAGQQHCELVAAEPERLATVPQSCGHLREDAIARRMPVAGRSRA